MQSITNLNFSFNIDGYQFKILNQDKSAEEVLYFFNRNKEYFIQFENIDPNDQTVSDVFTKVPEGININQKYIIGIYSKDLLVSFIECIKDRHRPNEWLLSLIIIDTALRGTGLGKTIIKAFESHLSNLGVTYLVLGVLEKNVNAIKFWTSLNYTKTNITQDQNKNGKIMTVRSYYKQLPTK